ncbi:hypothetical protein CAL26_09670 [Bordetella genomosp. 9]|uniref:Fido domain-containing protein n=1 Tax=Bordetella genomosp. 9 TaxID=1416803 RepID=A0A261RFI3_9BORD|nr:hypothetical protein [Bordetella genomosp. 9]OZI23691.1 hypothetical protein CAL26_09670 [Bordetella genomosp. 9]
MKYVPPRRLAPKRYSYRQIPAFQQLSHALGEAVAVQLVQELKSTYPTADTETLGVALSMEASLLSRRISHFHRLRALLAVSYSARRRAMLQSPGDAASATDWIVKASLSSNDRRQIRGVIDSYVASRASLSNIEELAVLNRRLAPNARKGPRVIDITGSPLPSSTAGAAVFKQESWRLQRLEGQPMYPPYLLACVLGYHPFPDGNGRTARAAYAITAIRQGSFEPLASEEERKISGLHPQQ